MKLVEYLPYSSLLPPGPQPRARLHAYRADYGLLSPQAQAVAEHLSFVAFGQFAFAYYRITAQRAGVVRRAAVRERIRRLLPS
jgi:hypothetical protein